MGTMRNVYTILIKYLMGISHLGETGAQGRLILKCILKKQVVGVLTGLNWIRVRSIGKLQQKQIINHNRPIKYWEFHEHLSDPAQ
jgi:hypothetical protein